MPKLGMIRRLLIYVYDFLSLIPIFSFLHLCQTRFNVLRFYASPILKIEQPCLSKCKSESSKC